MPLVDLLFKNVNVATMVDGLGIIESGAVAVCGNQIEWVGAVADVSPAWDVKEEIEGRGRWLTPGLIDCHTHLVWAGDRAQEFEMRMGGASYADISAAGGGIRSTVRATRDASEEDLFRSARKRRNEFLRDGLTTLDVKSGYGLDLETERKMLRVARRLGDDGEVRVRTGFLGAHTQPGDFDGSPDDYLDWLIETVIPELRKENLIDYVDGFCETIGFDYAQMERFFSRVQEIGLPMRLHADQLSDIGAAELVARFGGWSADHVEYTDELGVKAMGESGTVAVLLPVAFCTIRETQRPPVEFFRKSGVKMAVSTDCNPGTAPCTSLHLAMNLACNQFGLTVEEVWQGVTVHAAQALGVADQVGQIRKGMIADLALWDFDEMASLPYWAGSKYLPEVWKSGVKKARAHELSSSL